MRKILTLALLAAVSPAVAQTQSSTNAPGDPFGDDKVVSELAARGLTSLLDRALQNSKMPEVQKDSLRALAALRDQDPNRTTKERQELARKLAAGISYSLPQLNDPKLMTDLANALLVDAAGRDINTLEYWGDNPATMASLRPVAEAVVALLDRAAGVYGAQADKVANTLKSPDDPAAARYEVLATAAQGAAYNARMADYVLALSMDPADPKRRQIAAKAIEYLSQFDNPDSQVQPAVRLRLGKLHLVAGNYDASWKVLDSVANATADVQPQPSVAQQYEAKYFAALADLLGNHIDVAQARLNDLAAWQQSQFAASPSALAGAAAAAAMLQYRIHVAANKSDEAVATLLALVKERPDLSAVIYEQLMARLPEDADLTKVDPLMLEALVRRADQERLKPESEKPDQKVLERGLAAAQQLLTRPNVDSDLARNATLAAAFIQEKLGRFAPAAAAFLDYAEKHPEDRNAAMALDGAQTLIARLRKDAADDPNTSALYDRFLPIAINPPYSREQFAFEYASRLQRMGKYADAATFYDRVPASDPRSLQARFFRMLALKQLIDEGGPAATNVDRAQVPQLAAGVTADAKAALAKNPPADEARTLKLILARTLLISADLVRASAPQQTLDQLATFEADTAGLPNAGDLAHQAMYLRVNALMALHRNAEATQILVTLLEKTGGSEGADIVFNLLTKLNTDLDRARARNDIAAVRQIAKDRAELSGFLVGWARENPDPRIKKFAYRYALFDADTKRLAAELVEDPAARRQLQEQALGRYKSLQSPDNVHQYQAALPAGADPAYPDPAVTFGLAATAYDLGQFREAQPLLAKLLADRKLGQPVIPQTDDAGQTKLVDNDRYWEATLKLLRSNLELSKADKNPAIRDDTVSALKRLYIQWGNKVGGARWHAEFEALRTAIAPDFQPPDLNPATQAS